MKVAIVTSVSGKIAWLAGLTTPNKLEYCLRHGYSLLVENRPYADAVRNVGQVVGALLDRFDLVWALDADAVITNMTVPIHTLGCLGAGATVCEEGIVSWNRLNCGSVVWKAGEASRRLLAWLEADHDKWVGLPCQWQTWMAGEPLADGLVTVAPQRAFNSCVWTHPGGTTGQAGSHWRPGDLVYHPCGVFPLEARGPLLESVLATWVTR